MIMPVPRPLHHRSALHGFYNGYDGRSLKTLSTYLVWFEGAHRWEACAYDNIFLQYDIPEGEAEVPKKAISLNLTQIKGFISSEPMIKSFLKNSI